MGSDYQAWWDGLSAARRAEAVALSGAMPAWMAESLTAAGLAPVAARLADGDGYRTVYLTPQWLTDFLAVKRMSSRWP